MVSTEFVQFHLMWQDHLMPFILTKVVLMCASLTERKKQCLYLLHYTITAVRCNLNHHGHTQMNPGICDLVRYFEFSVLWITAKNSEYITNSGFWRLQPWQLKYYNTAITTFSWHTRRETKCAPWCSKRSYINVATGRWVLSVLSVFLCTLASGRHDRWNLHIDTVSVAPLCISPICSPCLPLALKPHPLIFFLPPVCSCIHITEASLITWRLPSLSPYKSKLLGIRWQSNSLSGASLDSIERQYPSFSRCFPPYLCSWTLSWGCMI